MVDLGVHFTEAFAGDVDLLAAEAELELLRFRPAPAWLGSFDLLCFGEGYGRGRKLPEACRALAVRCIEAMPKQLPSGSSIRYNASFLQRYRPGFSVRPHVDPSTNIGYTSILSLGSFSHPPTLHVKGSAPLTPRRGDLVVLPCWRDGVPGPLHSVDGHPDQEGVRYTIIVNAVQLSSPTR